MSSQLLGILIDILIIALLFLYLKFGLNRSRSTKKEGSMQEVDVLIKGVYAPNVIEAELGKPLRINFNRDEEVGCSEYVIFPDFKIRKRLPAHEVTPVEFTPNKTGEFEFSCSMGMYQGKLIVR